METISFELFDPVLKKAKLRSLVLGKPFPDNIRESLCSVTELWTKCEILSADWKKVTIKHFMGKIEAGIE